jgi:hypothetical protein
LWLIWGTTYQPVKDLYLVKKDLTPTCKTKGNNIIVW